MNDLAAFQISFQATLETSQPAECDEELDLGDLYEYAFRQILWELVLQTCARRFKSSYLCRKMSFTILSFDCKEVEAILEYSFC